MKSIPAGQFKAKCLNLMDRVQETREPVLITKRGKPIAKLIPVDQGSDDFIGRLEGLIKIVGDIESPIEPPEAWEVSR
jgi:prevent-host-death family protein